MKANEKGMAPVIVFVVLVIAVVVGGLYLFTQNTPEVVPSQAPTLNSSDDTNEDVSLHNKVPAETELSGHHYIAYTKEAYEEVKEKAHVLFFYASWCPTCRPADAEIKTRISELAHEYTVVRVNYNDTDTEQAEKDLAEQHEITYQHTFVLIENGEVVKRWNGGGMDKLLSEVQ